MTKNANLNKARKSKNDEFYTQYKDIEKEIENYIEYNPDIFKNKTLLLPCDDPEGSNFTKYFVANFDRFGIRKLISTSYTGSLSSQSILKLKKHSDKSNPTKHIECGKIFVLDRDVNKSGKVDFSNLQFDYLHGNGDFRSKEVIELRDKSDIIITNPPFSLFREFIKWIEPTKRHFLVIGNINDAINKEIFPLIKNSIIWLGIHNGDMAFQVPDNYPPRKTRYWVDEHNQKWRSLGNINWFTNLDYGQRHKDLILYKHYLPNEYPKYDNYGAISVDKTADIPMDFNGAMGVPITFLNKYSPEQFKIIGADEAVGTGYSNGLFLNNSKNKHVFVNGKGKYKRIFIRNKHPENCQDKKDKRY